MKEKSVFKTLEEIARKRIQNINTGDMEKKVIEFKINKEDIKEDLSKEIIKEIKKRQEANKEITPKEQILTVVYCNADIEYGMEEIRMNDIENFFNKNQRNYQGNNREEQYKKQEEIIRQEWKTGQRIKRDFQLINLLNKYNGNDTTSNKNNLDNIYEFLDNLRFRMEFPGCKREIKYSLEEMRKAVSEEDYERAAVLRDTINSSKSN